MAYRDDRQALALELAALERENEGLRRALEDAERRYRDAVEDGHRDRARGSRHHCAMCGGSLLPVAVFAGHDIRAPLPLSMSTLRFGSPQGGFTHAAPIRSLACASCGYIHNFIDMAPSEDRAPTEPPRARPTGQAGGAEQAEPSGPAGSVASPSPAIPDAEPE